LDDDRTYNQEKGGAVKGSSAFSRPDSLVCPLCEVDQLRPSGNDSAQCASCAGLVSGAMLEALRRISALPDALGKHACEECGHPEMRLLPDETYHCPGCGSEVLPIDAPSTRHEGGTTCR
jgi:ribosomal protein L37AE/L43A